MEKVKSIKTSKDYIDALAEYEILWEAKEPENVKRFEQLAAMLLEFEKENFPNKYKKELEEAVLFDNNVEFIKPERKDK